MLRFPLKSIDPIAHFPQLAEIPEPPRNLHMRGTLEHCKGKKLLAVVGSRRYSSYGKQVCESLIAGLAGYPIVIVSGLALGIDAIAHQAALDAGLTTLAFPGSGLNWNVLYPAQHRSLAESILDSGGALLSEYEHDTRGAHWTFPRRNRLEAGIAHMTLVIEAEADSGTLITARLATDYNSSVGAVPGPITSPSSYGTNWLLKMGAVPVTEPADILKELGLTPLTTRDVAAFHMLSKDEERVLAALSEPKTKDELIDELGLDPAQAGILFTSLEIKGVVTETLGILERIA